MCLYYFPGLMLFVVCCLRMSVEELFLVIHVHVSHGQFSVRSLITQCFYRAYFVDILRFVGFDGGG